MMWIQSVKRTHTIPHFAQNEKRACPAIILNFSTLSRILKEYSVKTAEKGRNTNMILHMGERVYWGAPEVIYLEGPIVKLDGESQSVTVHIERATPHSAHLIGSDIVFAADGLTPLKGSSPPGTTDERRTQALPPRVMSDDEKVRRAAAVAVHQQFGYNLPPAQETALIDQVAGELNNDPATRARIIASMDAILQREHSRDSTL